MNVTRAGQREATRQALLDAAVGLVCSEGLAAVTTRRVAQAVEVSQSAVMHHFPSRQDLHTAAVTQLARGIEREARTGMEALAESGFDAERTLDLAWRIFATPQALAVAQLWMAAGTEPAYVDAVRELELMIVGLGAEALRPVADRFGGDAAVFAFMDTVFSVIRGLVVSVAVWGMAPVEARWEASKQLLLRLVPPAA